MKRGELRQIIKEEIQILFEDDTPTGWKQVDPNGQLKVIKKVDGYTPKSEGSARTYSKIDLQPGIVLSKPYNKRDGIWWSVLNHREVKEVKLSTKVVTNTSPSPRNVGAYNPKYLKPKSR